MKKSPLADPNSPGLNPVDYAISRGGATGASLPRMKLDAVDQLKQAIVLPLRALSQRFIAYSIGEWRHSYLTVDLASLSKYHTDFQRHTIC